MLLTMKPLISISIVSHLQGHLLDALLSDLNMLCTDHPLEVLLTLNLPEALPFELDMFSFPVKKLENVTPLGFSANHNKAFAESTGQYFCVMNPDIRLLKNPFPILLEELEKQDAAVIAPAVLSPAGKVEDSIRKFPTLFSLASKMFGVNDGRYSFATGDRTFTADWAGGMFMLFHAEDFRCVNGFDEGFFLYYEDVDICARLWNKGRSVAACPKVQVTHDARRTSYRNFQYMRWHLSSMVRYFRKNWFHRLNTTKG